MVEVIYDGNLGNNLFQYCFGRILAEKLGYSLKAKPIDGFIGTAEAVQGKEYARGALITLRGQRPDISFLDRGDPHCRIVLTGYFQRTEFFQQHKDKIRCWLRQDSLTADEVRDDDLVMGIRRGKDYIPRHGLPLSYYETALQAVKHRRLFICTNDPTDPFVTYLKTKHHAIIRPTGALDNFKFIMQFQKIIISNSTFLWWPAYLSDASEIVFPRPQNGFWSTDDPLSRDIALEVPEPRYRYVNAARYRSDFVGERLRTSLEQCIGTIRSKLRWMKPSKPTTAPQHRFSEP